MNLRKIGPLVLMNTEAGGEPAGGGGAAASVAGAGGEGPSEHQDGDDDFGSFDDVMQSLGGDIEEGDDGEGGDKTAAPAPAAAPAPVAAPAPAAPAAPAVEPAAPAQAPAAPTAAPAAGPTPEQVQEQRVQARQAALNSLTESWKQQLPPDIVDSILDNPHEHLPVLMAQVEMRALESTMSQVIKQLPVMLQNYVAQQNSAATLEQTFFAEYPALKEHEAEVALAVQMVQHTPGFDFSNPVVRKRIAGMVMAEKGLAFGQPAPAPVATPVPTARPTPRPVGSSAAPAAATTPNANPWADLMGDD